MRRTTLLQRVIKILGISALTILFFACTEGFFDEFQIGKQKDKATVSFSVTDGSARSVLPQVSLADAAWYKLLGEKDGKLTILVESFTGTGISISLEPGIWNFTLTAYNSSDEPILQGKVRDKQIILAGTNQISFYMSGINSGIGAIEITFNFPATAGITKIIATYDNLVSENFTTTGADSFVYTKNEIAAGNYFVSFTLCRDDVPLTTVSEQVTVWSNLTSSKTITIEGADLKPVLTGTVSIYGNAVVGETLTAGTSALGGTGAISYQWKKRSSSYIYDMIEYAIIDACSDTYTVQANDWSYTIIVTVTRDGYTGSVTSSPTVTVPNPTSVTLNSVTADGDSTQTTTVLTLVFKVSNTSYIFSNLTADDIILTHSLGQSVVKGVPVRTGPTYSDGYIYSYYLPISGFLSGGTLSVAVAKSGYSISGSPKEITIYFYSITLMGTVGIDGTLQEGQTLTAVTNLSGNGEISYQWRRGETVVGTNSTYTVVSTDVGETNFRLRVTRAEYDNSIDSAPMLTGGTVSITGTNEVGQTLTAAASSLGGSGDIYYQWRRGGTAIIGATGSTYTLQAADVGSTITAAVSRSGNSGSIYSNSTPAINKGEGGIVNTPTLATRTGSSITVNAVIAPGNGQTVEYAISTTTTAPVTGWQDSTTFNDLNASTAYYIYARTKENDAYRTGASKIAEISTLNNYTVTANGSLGEKTTQLTFTFSVDPGNITASDITLSGNASKSSATLSGSGTTRTLSPITVSGSATGSAAVSIPLVAGIDSGSKPVTVYNPITYTVIANGSSNSKTTTLTFTFSANPGSALSDNNITISGNASKSSATLSGSGTTRTLSPINVSGDTTGSATVSIYANGIETGSKTVTVYNPVTYTVNFNSNGGSVVGSYTVIPGTAISVPSNPTRLYHIFQGWYKEPELINIWAFGSDVVTANITLYAKWRVLITNIGTIAFYLQTLSTGDNKSDLAYLPMQIQLETNYIDRIDWDKLLRETSGKFIDLDLSACSMYGTTFDAGTDLRYVGSIYDGDLYYTTLFGNIIHITLPDSTKIVDGSFEQLSNLTSVTIGDNVLEIKSYVFECNQNFRKAMGAPRPPTQQKSPLTNVTLGNKLYKIWSFAFQDNQLTSIVIPNSVKIIEKDAFKGNPLTSVTIGDNVDLSYSEFDGLGSVYVQQYNKAAGTYTRPDTNSPWTKQP